MAPVYDMTARLPANPRAPHIATAAIVARFGDDAARHLYETFHTLNKRFFDSRLAAPLILITGAKSARTLADYCPRDVHGLESRIRISPKASSRGALFAADVLLHEMVHAWQTEVSGDLEPGYRGHGPDFAAKCNEIGEALGLPEVGVKGRDGLPDCAQWPCNVRPDGYYPEPFVASTRRKKAEPEPAEPEGEAEPAPAPKGAVERILFLVRQLDDASVRALHEGIEEVIAERE